MKQYPVYSLIVRFRLPWLAGTWKPVLVMGWRVPGLWYRIA